MSVLLGRATSRRTLLRGLAGATLLSPLLRRAEAQAQGLKRPFALIVTYANGSHPGWTPSGTESDFTLSPHLAPLNKHKADILVLKKMTVKRGGGNPHAASGPSHLTGSAGPNGPSIDQLLADAWKGTTPVPSLEFGLLNACMSYSMGGKRLPQAMNPADGYRRVAEKLAPGTRPAEAGQTTAFLAARRSLLDHVSKDVETFRKRTGSVERGKIDSYLEQIRQLERNLVPGTGQARAEGEGKCRGVDASKLVDERQQRQQLQLASRQFIDIAATAFTCGITRVAALAWGGSQCNGPLPWLNVSNWHTTSHGGGNAIAQLQTSVHSDFAYAIDRFKELDIFGDALMLITTQHGDSKSHTPDNSPFVLAGTCSGAIKRTGRMIDCGGRAQNDLYVAMAQACGLKTTTFGDAGWSRGALPGLLG